MKYINKPEVRYNVTQVGNSIEVEGVKNFHQNIYLNADSAFGG